MEDPDFLDVFLDGAHDGVILGLLFFAACWFLDSQPYGSVLGF